jgi:hypothetical protein
MVLSESAPQELSNEWSWLHNHKCHLDSHWWGEAKRLTQSLSVGFKPVTSWPLALVRDPSHYTTTAPKLYYMYCSVKIQDNEMFMPPIIKCRGHYVMAYASVAVNIWFPSIIGQTPGSTWSIDLIFLWLIGGWLEEGSFRWSAPPLIQDGRRPSWILFPSIRGQMSIWFFCGSLGMTYD